MTLEQRNVRSDAMCLKFGDPWLDNPAAFRRGTVSNPDWYSQEHRHNRTLMCSECKRNNRVRAGKPNANPPVKSKGFGFLPEHCPTCRIASAHITEASQNIDDDGDDEDDQDEAKGYTYETFARAFYTVSHNNDTSGDDFVDLTSPVGGVSHSVGGVGDASPSVGDVSHSHLSPETTPDHNNSSSECSITPLGSQRDSSEVDSDSSIDSPEV